MWEVEELAKGQQLLSPGRPEDSFYKVETGLLALIALDHRGGTATLELVGPGGTMCERSLVTRSTLQYGARAVLPSTLSRLHVRFVREPERLAPAVLAVLCARLRVQQDTICRNHSRDVAQRLASLLLDLDLLLHIRRDEPAGLPKELTQADLARVLATSRESVSAYVRGFERRGWIRRTPDRLIVTPRAVFGDRSSRAQDLLLRADLIRNVIDRQSALAHMLAPAPPPFHEPTFSDSMV